MSWATTGSPQSSSTRLAAVQATQRQPQSNSQTHLLLRVLHLRVLDQVAARRRGTRGGTSGGTIGGAPVEGHMAYLHHTAPHTVQRRLSCQWPVAGSRQRRQLTSRCLWWRIWESPARKSVGTGTGLAPVAAAGRQSKSTRVSTPASQHMKLHAGDKSSSRTSSPRRRQRVPPPAHSPADWPAAGTQSCCMPPRPPRRPAPAAAARECAHPAASGEQ